MIPDPDPDPHSQDGYGSTTLFSLFDKFDIAGEGAVSVQWARPGRQERGGHVPTREDKCRLVERQVGLF